jgi:ribose/xylose/arabinose/galactoside ABC-type transport system permease subunit
MSSPLDRTAETQPEAALVTAGRWSELLRSARDNVQASGVGILLVGLFVVTGLHSSLFLSVENLKVLAMNMAFVGIAGVGMALLIITANVDLSIGSVLGLTAVYAASFSKSLPVPVALVLAMLIGAGIGTVNGVVVWNVPTSPLIVTLGSMTFLQGVLYVVSGGAPVSNVPPRFTEFANSQPLGVPTPVWIFIGTAVLGFLFLTFTRTGRHCYAVGGNREASRAAGIKVRRIVIGVFAVNGLLVGLVGALEASLYGSPDQTYGNGFELQVITAVIVGGVSFMGGEGGIIRAMLGVALLTVVGGAIVSFGVDANYAYVVNGAILVAAVSVDTVVQRQRDRYQKTIGRRDLARAEAEHAASEGVVGA